MPFSKQRRAKQLFEPLQTLHNELMSLTFPVEVSAWWFYALAVHVGL